MMYCITALQLHSKDWYKLNNELTAQECDATEASVLH